MANLNTADDRISTLKLLIQWEGLLNRSRVSTLLNISAPRASQWIREFKETYPEWLTYDHKSKNNLPTYQAHKALNSANNSQSLSTYLSLINAPHVIANSDNYICAAFPDLSTPSPAIFSGITQAIVSSKDLKIKYRSMSNPKAHERTVTPHHLVRVGRRWHVRAYCLLNNDFRDYSLGRISHVEVMQTSIGKPSSEDTNWETLVKVRLVAHSGLSLDQQQVIREEFFHGTMANTIHCRAALVGYFIQDIRAATDPNVHKPPEYQLEISNIDEISPWLFP